MFESSQDMKVDIIVMYEALESLAIRSLLESLGIQVRIHYVGNVQQLVYLLQQEELHKIVILSCHGDEEGLILPALSNDLELQMQYHNHLKSSDFLQFLNLHEQIIINTGCCLGSAEFSGNFITKGASAYIGSVDYIEGGVLVIFMITLLYYFLSKKVPLIEAFERACNLDEQLKSMQLIEKNAVINSI